VTVMLARYHDFEVEHDGPYFSMRMPVYGDSNYYVCHTADHEQAVKEVKQFIAEAEAALDELEALA